MKRLLLLGLALAGIAAVPALAQESGPAVSKPARTEAGCELPTEALVVICAESTVVNEHGQFVGGTVFVQLADEGFVQFTRCTPLIMECDPAFFRAEGANQGDAMALVPMGE